MKPSWKTPAFWLAFMGGVLVYVLGWLQTTLPTMGLPSAIATIAVPILAVIINFIKTHYALTQDPSALGIKAAATPLPKPPSALNR